MRLIGPLNTGVAVGSNGSATANNTTSVPVSGLIYGVYVKYNDSPPAGTTDVTIATLGTSPSPPALTILTLTNAATDGWFYPRHVNHSNAGVAAATTEAVPVFDFIKVTIAQANAPDSVDVWLLVSDD